MEESDERNEEFKVTDKRRFTTEGETKDETEAQGQESVKPEPEKVEQERESREQDRSEESETKYLPPLDFSSFVLSLANTALFQLGLIKGPETGTEKDLQGARQTIDIIAMLEEKTQGNLTDAEKKIITEALFQLRMAFVDASK
ncbi:MAG: DUF1844 domain-containing protein [Deltaproteobacteria bacterium]